MLLSPSQTRPPLALLPERARHGSLARKFDSTSVYTSSTEHFLGVPLDWNNKTGASFKIRYHIDSTAFDPASSTAPVFVSMGGEGTSSGAHCSALAFRHKALCVAIEHRFYGKSVPTDGVKTSNYRTGLYIEQNLADTAAVIDAVQAKYGGPRPVLNFGGSYSGATCAWFRQAHHFIWLCPVAYLVFHLSIAFAK